MTVSSSASPVSAAWRSSVRRKSANVEPSMTVNCSSTVTTFTNDAQAFVNGYGVLSPL